MVTLGGLQQLQRLRVTAALKKMAELRIESRRQGLFEAFDSFRNFAEPFHVTVRIAAALFIGDDTESFAESAGEID